ncbi:MAG: hypothetical protein KDG89_07200 [Geminicoccaceae bacterium]|nr:hypothetical protein [Geminicoccaceae bacterium]
MKDGCILHPNNIKKRLEVSLGRDAIKVSDLSPYTLMASFLGYGSYNYDNVRRGCWVNYSFTIELFKPGTEILVLARSFGLLSGPNARDQEALAQAEAFADEVAAAILQARLRKNNNS